jgi:hypothetical protein
MRGIRDPAGERLKMPGERLAGLFTKLAGAGE